MKILIALDANSYSAEIISDVTKLAANTWADVTMLAVQSRGEAECPDATLVKALSSNQKNFFAQYQGGELPHGEANPQGFMQTTPGVWQTSGSGRKEFTLKIRSGEPIKEILAEAGERQCDLIILGCSKDNGCQWDAEIDLPQKIARDADCSVLVIKEGRIPKNITCCLDQAMVSQESLEMVSQIVNLHQADLKIVGLTGPKGLPGKGEVEKKMQEILHYYTARKVTTLIKLVDNEDLEKFVERATREGMIALWMGKKSLLAKIFSKDLIGKLVATSNSSALILR
ncbi:MAG: universal stress protein [Desulfobulbaceae bacterium]|nr:universal stress protein [Desulfobulbaceae bacterium]